MWGHSLAFNVSSQNSFISSNSHKPKSIFLVLAYLKWKNLKCQKKKKIVYICTMSLPIFYYSFPTANWSLFHNSIFHISKGFNLINYSVHISVSPAYLYLNKLYNYNNCIRKRHTWFLVSKQFIWWAKCSLLENSP